MDLSKRKKRKSLQNTKIAVMVEQSDAGTMCPPGGLSSVGVPPCCTVIAKVMLEIKTDPRSVVYRLQVRDLVVLPLKQKGVFAGERQRKQQQCCNVCLE